jgi:hypothetical protein
MEKLNLDFLKNYLDPAEIDKRSSNDQSLNEIFEVLEIKTSQLLESLEKAPHFEVQEGIESENQECEISSILENLNSEITDLQDFFTKSFNKVN